MSGRRPNTTATYDTVCVRITISVVLSDGVPTDWFWSATPEKVPLSMTPSPETPDRVVFTVDGPYDALSGERIPAAPFRWQGGEQPGGQGGIVMDSGWDPSWGVPVRASGQDQHNYELKITQTGPRTNHPYRYTVNLEYGSTPISFDPEIELGSA